MLITPNGYSPENVEILKSAYPVGAHVVVYRAVTMGADKDTPRFYGTVVAVNNQGVHVEVHDANNEYPAWHDSMDGSSFQQCLHPGTDRFTVISDNDGLTKSLTEVLADRTE